MRSSLLTTVLVSFSVAARLILFLYTFTTAMRISVRVTCPPKERHQGCKHWLSREGSQDELQVVLVPERADPVLPYAHAVPVMSLHHCQGYVCATLLLWSTSKISMASAACSGVRK